jgi:hypothetical protein
MFRLRGRVMRVEWSIMIGLAVFIVVSVLAIEARKLLYWL